MNIIVDKKYPDADTYEGNAHKGYIEFGSLRTGIESIDNFAAWVAEEVVKIQTETNGGVMLQTKIWNEESSWGIPTYNWRLEFYFYIPGEVQAAAVPYIILIGIAALLVGVGVWIATKGVVDVIWGPAGPGGERPLPIIPLAIGGLIIFIGYKIIKIIKGDIKF